MYTNCCVAGIVTITYAYNLKIYNVINKGNKNQFGSCDILFVYNHTHTRWFVLSQVTNSQNNSEL